MTVSISSVGKGGNVGVGVLLDEGLDESDVAVALQPYISEMLTTAIINSRRKLYLYFRGNSLMINRSTKTLMKIV